MPPRIKIDEKLLAHIHNDAFLVGSVELEGNTFATTIGYLNQYIAQCLPEEISDDLKRLQVACSRLVEYEASISQDTLALTIHNDLKRLPSGQFLLVPGGWRGSQGGHAMIYQFEAKQNGDLIVRIHNSGSGLEQYHAKAGDKDKNRYNPVLSYKIPKKNHYDPSFVHFINTLLNMQRRNGAIEDNDKNAHYLYQHFAFLYYWHGEIIDDTADETKQRWYTAGQLSGTCAQRSLHQMLKASFHSTDTYRRFIYGFKRYALDDYFSNLSPDDLSNPKIQSQIIKAIRHTLRLLNLKSTDNVQQDLFSLNKKQQDSLALTQALSRLKVVKRSPADEERTMESVPIDPVQFDFPYIDPLTTIQSEFNQPEILPTISMPKDLSLLEQMQWVKKNLSLVSGKRFYAQRSYQLLERFFHQLTLPEQYNAPLTAYYAGIVDTPATELTFYHLLEELQLLYLDCCKTLNATALPRVKLAHLSVMSLLRYIRLNAKVNPNLIFSPYDYIRRFLLEHSHDVTLGMKDVHMDKRLQALKALEMTAPTQAYRALDAIKNYQRLLERFSSKALIEELNQRYTETYEYQTPSNLKRTLMGSNGSIQWDYRALYYVKNHLLNDFAVVEEKYQPLVTQFKLQQIIESVYTEGKIDQKNFLDIKPDYPPRIAFHEDKYLELHRSTTRQLQFDSPSTENYTQLTHKSKSKFRRPDYNLHELYHLRHVLADQIPLVLDYYNRQLEKLTRNGFDRIYLEAMLFQPCLLLEQLETRPQRFFAQFDTFIKNGLIFFINPDGLSQESLFFIRLAYQVNAYAAQAFPEQYSVRLHAFAQQIQELINNTSDKKIRASLYAYPVLIAASSHANLNLPGLFEQSLHAFFQLQLMKNTDEIIEKDSDFQRQCAYFQWEKLITQQQDRITAELLIAILKSVGIAANPSALKLESNFPQYQFKLNGQMLYVLDVLQGLIFNQNGMAAKQTPVEINTKPVLKQMGITAPPFCFQSLNGGMIEWGLPKSRFRFFVSRYKDESSIQKEWEYQGETQWYQLCPLSKAQASELYIGSQYILRYNNLPKIITEQGTIAWVSVGAKGYSNELPRTILFSHHNNQLIYAARDAYQHKQTEIIQLRTQQPLCWNHHPITDRLSVFEAPTFMVVSGTTTSSYTIELARYRLAFIASSLSGPIHFQWQGLSYQLQDQSHHFGNGVAHLVFSNNESTLCLLAIQRFLSTNTRAANSEYYHLAQDINAKIPEDALEQSKLTKHTWQHSATQEYLMLTMHNEQPIPETPAQALYLCYIYLGCNQANKAWAVLDVCQTRLGGLSGSYEELRYLYWIMQQLPYSSSPTKTQVATIANPPFVSCKLKALALFTEFTAQDKPICFPTPPQTSGLLNQLYEQSEIKSVKTFYHSIGSEILRLYTLLQPMRRELEVCFRLSDEEVLSLLQFQKGEGRVVGALGYEWLRLHLSTLKKEWAGLNFKAMHTSLSPFESKRKQNIEDYVRDHQGINRRTSRLESCSINIPNITNLISLEGLSSSWIDSSNENKPPEAPLTSCTTLYDVKRNLAYYVKLAKTKQPLKEFNALKLFCQASLVMIHYRKQRGVVVDSEVDEKDRLMSLLYHLCCSNDTKWPIVPRDITTVGQDVPRFMAVMALNAANVKPDPITILLLKDTTDTLLVRTQELWASIPAPLTPETPLIDNSCPMLQSFHDELPQLQAPLQVWRELDLIFRVGRSTNTDGKEPIPKKTMDQAIAQLNRLAVKALSDDKSRRQLSQAVKTIRKEPIPGKVIYQALAQLKRLAIEVLGDDKSRSQLSQAVKTIRDDLSATQEVLSQSILTLGNLGPADITLKQAWNIDVAAKNRTPLSLKALLVLYFHHDVARYQAETGLTKEQIQQLHSQLARYIAQGIKQQQCTRVQQLMNEVNQTTAPPAKNQAIFELAKAIFAENQIDGVDDPVLGLFQFHANMLLRPQQKEAINRLLSKSPANGSYTEIIEKIIMGGGKSKVLLPTLAKKKATGSNLVVIEVPRALLRTNFIDLRASSAQLFNQTAYIFEFNRDSQISASRLEGLYHRFTQIMVNKNYLITTGDALQSLELKTLELLSIPLVDQDEAWSNQVTWACKLVSLLRHCGDLIIDEVHQGLRLKNKLNYTIGAPSHLKAEVIQQCVELFVFFKHVKVHDNPPLTLADILKHNHHFTHPEQFKQACKQLADALVDHPKSPLYAMLQNAVTAYPTVAEDIKLYLKEERQTIPPFVLNASAEIKNTLALYKEQVSQLLPYTLMKNHGEHYGPSQANDHSPQTRAISIPYVANNVPNERSRFGNYLEASNYTIQSLIIGGITKPLLHQYFIDLQHQARQELMREVKPSLNSTTTGQAFCKLLKHHGVDLTFSDLNLDDDELMSRLHQVLQHDETITFELLRTQILKHIRIDPCILHSNAYNHVDIVRSCQGMSGTPSNYSTFHQRLQFDQRASYGTYDYVLCGIKAKKPAIHTINFSNTQQFLQQLLTINQATPHIRAIIDIGAIFKGIDNLTIVRALSTVFKQAPKQFQSPEPLQYILFFNQDDMLCAWNLKGQADQTPVMIGSSDPGVISQRLNCQPGACFTFYDQAHTVGADIMQADNAKALVLIDHDTPLQSFLQGSMRMRALIEGNQSIDIIVPSSLDKMPLMALTDIMLNNQQRQLQCDNYEAALLKMTGLIRADLMQRILNVSSLNEAKKKAALFKQYQAFFIETNTADIFSQYGHISQERLTKDLLEEHQHQLISQWIKLTSAELSEQLRMNQAMTVIIKQALMDSASTQLSPHQAFSTQVMVQQEHQKQMQNQVQNEFCHQIQDPNRTEQPYEPWPISMNALTEKKLGLKTLTEVCQQKSGQTPQFSDQIVMTKNYYQTYRNQPAEAFVSDALKPVHALLFQPGEPLKCTILSQEELKQLRNRLKPTDWISTTQHTVLAGNPPEGFERHAEYQSIIEQVRYFNGEISLLLSPDQKLTWLKQDTKTKLRFLKNHLSHSRDMDDKSIDQLTQLLLQDAAKAYHAEDLNESHDTPKLKQLRTLCQQYMNYALKELAPNRASSSEYPEEFPIDTNLTRYNLLAKKYNFTKEIFDLAQPEKDAERRFNGIKTKLSAKECNTLLIHRDSKFTRLLATLWGILSALPRRLFYTSLNGSVNHHAFWKSKGNIFVDDLKKTINTR